jgi:GNAT superfamily N-acetyltransferase
MTSSTSSHSPNPDRMPVTSGLIRRALPSDVDEILHMVRELAEYERLADQAVATPAQFHAALFGASPAVYAFVVDDDPDAGTLAGFAIYFLNFSTWLGVHGLYLEDLYIRPQFRGRGFGKRLLATMARVCVDEGYGRFEWWVLDWNADALAVYESIGAVPMDEWTVQRVTGQALIDLAAQADPLPAVPPAQHGPLT